MTSEKSGKLGVASCYLVLALSLITINASDLVATETDSSALCATPSLTPRWRLLVVKKQRFCLTYPAEYAPRKSLTPAFPFGVEHGKLIAELNSTITTDAKILFLFSNAAFNIKRLVHEAPTGLDDVPPSPRQFGAHTFFEYGPGGGGVEYPDEYFFNLRGQLLRIVFDGPYGDNAKSPSKHTQQLEIEMLHSFKTF